MDTLMFGNQLDCVFFNLSDAATVFLFLPTVEMLTVPGIRGSGTDFIEYLATLLLKFVSAPGSHRGAEGDGDGCASTLLLFPTQYIRRCPLVPAQRRSIELPATTWGE